MYKVPTFFGKNFILKLYAVIRFLRVIIFGFEGPMGTRKGHM